MPFWKKVGVNKWYKFVDKIKYLKILMINKINEKPCIKSKVRYIVTKAV